jgi:hypothetical protein
MLNGIFYSLFRKLEFIYFFPQQARSAGRHLGGSSPNSTPFLKRLWHRISGTVVLREGEEIYRRKSDKAVNAEKASSSTGPRNEENTTAEECVVCQQEYSNGDVIKRLPSCNVCTILCTVYDNKAFLNLKAIFN